MARERHGEEHDELVRVRRVGRARVDLVVLLGLVALVVVVVDRVVPRPAAGAHGFNLDRALRAERAAEPEEPVSRAVLFERLVVNLAAATHEVQRGFQAGLPSDGWRVRRMACPSQRSQTVQNSLAESDQRFGLAWPGRKGTLDAKEHARAMAGYSMNHFLESESSREEKAAKLLERLSTTSSRDGGARRQLSPRSRARRRRRRPRAAGGRLGVRGYVALQGAGPDRRPARRNCPPALDARRRPAVAEELGRGFQLCRRRGSPAELEPPEAIVEPLAEAVVEPLAVAVVEPLAEAVADTADSTRPRPRPRPCLAHARAGRARGQPPSRPLADSLPSPDACALEGAAPRT